MKDILVRAGKTFVEAAIPVFIALAAGVSQIKNYNEGFALVVAIVVGTVAAGISAVWNMAISAYKTSQAKGA